MGFGGGYGNGCGRWWLVAVGWVLQWVSVDFGGFCSRFWWALAVVVGWVFNGDSGLDLLMVAVAVSGGLGVFIWKKRYT